ncbi:putative T7SS-secreted protein [Microbacterium sp. NPDC019599]|uniref:putative T7SS-secreted protein n=1 Tax=Microbacterium sp. NPDC019599 TaxID=3154690 RepID=UPI0033EBBCEA
MRPADWSAAGLAADPIPGDPVAVSVGGRDYLAVADAIDRTARSLRSLGVDGQHAEAVYALAETAGTVADDISRAESRYRATGDALVEYAGVLESAQSQSLEALYQARSARDAASHASSDQHRYLALASNETDPATALRYTSLGDDAAYELRVADSQVAAAVERIDAARRDRDRAAEHARQRIHDTTADDGLNDSWWQDWGKDVLSVVTDVAGIVAAVAGILALAVSWIPVIGQVLAAALLLVAGIAAIVNAIGNVILASTGDRSWTEAIISIAGAALAVVGLGAAARVVGSAAAAGRINAAARLQAGFKGEMLTVREALRVRPSAMAESEALWRAPLKEVADGDVVYRLYGTPPGVPVGESARAWGASYSPTAPWELASVRSSLGLPSVNAADNLVIAEVTDASRNVLTRHALPLDGMPGGATEYIFPGSFGDLKGVDILDNVVFQVP